MALKRLAGLRIQCIKREALVSWSIHHVNLEAKDVRRAAAFYSSIFGMKEGDWVLPESAGYIQVQKDRLALFEDPTRDGQAAGLHLIKADPDNDRFPLKDKDLAMAAAFAYLRERGAFPEVEDDDDDEPCFGDDAFDNIDAL